MDYSKLPATIQTKVEKIITILNNPEIAPDIRQLNMERLFQTVGQATYAKIYAMNAWDMEIPHTIGKLTDTRFFGLAKITAGANVTNTDYKRLVESYLASMTGLAQDDAFTTAKESGKAPTLTRQLTGHGDCDWCRAKAGTVTNPEPEDFGRHTDCDCKLITKGYKSRNGLLKNYRRRNEQV